MNKNFLFMLAIGVIMTLPVSQSGTPDYGRSISSNPTIQSYEPGEDATRLLMGGGANSRSGRWLWATGFESSEAEFYSTIGVTLDTTLAYQGNKSAKIETTAVLNSLTSIMKTLYIPQLPDADSVKVAQESMVCLRFLAGDADYQWAIATRNTAANGNLHLVKLSKVGATAFLYYRDSTGAFILLRDISDYVTPPGGDLEQFHFTKMVVDIKTNRLVSFSFDDLYIPIDAAPLVGLTAMPVSSAKFEQRVQTRVAAVNAANTDNWILTSDEP